MQKTYHFTTVCKDDVMISVLTHRFKLVSFSHIYICCSIVKSRGISLTHVKSDIAGSVSLPFTFLRQSSTPPVGYRTAASTAAAPTTLLLVIAENQGWPW